jgi:hypothetical protein
MLWSLVRERWLPVCDNGTRNTQEEAGAEILVSGESRKVEEGELGCSQMADGEVCFVGLKAVVVAKR